MLTMTTLVLADEHIRDLHASAARHRRAALARGHRPGTWRRVTTRATAALSSMGERVRRGQRGRLGPAEPCPTCT
jgi:hypothetical protein